MQPKQELPWDDGTIIGTMVNPALQAIAASLSRSCAMQMTVFATLQCFIIRMSMDSHVTSILSSVQSPTICTYKPTDTA